MGNLACDSIKLLKKISMISSTIPLFFKNFLIQKNRKKPIQKIEIEKGKKVEEFSTVYKKHVVKISDLFSLYPKLTKEQAS